MIYVLIGVVVLVAVGGFVLIFGERLKNPKVGMAEISPEKMGDAKRPPLKVLHEALVAFADRQVSGERQKGIARRLEMGGSNMKASEWIVTAASVTLAAFVIGWLLRGPIVAPIAAGMTIFGFNFSLSRKVEKRQKVFGAQLGESLQLLSGSLRAGLSLQQALSVVAAEAPAPSGDEYRRVLAENRLGRDMTDAMYAMAHRIGSEDFEWVVGAVDINRHAGGDLSAILDRVSDTIRQRERVRGQVRALSAEGRMSGIVMGALPPGVMLIVSITTPNYLDGFTKTGIMGWTLLGGAGLLLVVGLVWLKKLTKFTY